MRFYKQFWTLKNLLFFKASRIWNSNFLYSHIFEIWAPSTCHVSYNHHKDMRQLVYIETTHSDVLYVCEDSRHIFRTIVLRLMEFLKKKIFLGFSDVLKFFVCLMYYNTRNTWDTFLCSWSISIIIIEIFRAYTKPTSFA